LNIFLYQKINNIETTRPLIAAGLYNGRKTGFIFGEGLWKWRLYDYLLHQTHNHFNELISQLIQYLALRENEDNFMISFEPVYSEVEDVLMKAEVYNDAFEYLSDAEINIVIENEEGNKLNFTFDVTDKGYILNAGNLPVGNYHFLAEVLIGNNKYTEEGRFSVAALNVENIITKANHRILFQMAGQSGGDFFTPGEMSELTSILKNNDNIKPVINFQEMIYEILNLKWLFFVLLVLLSSEWFLRKFWGLY
jgi:type I restriction-modification system DNA methylase subunit